MTEPGRAHLASQQPGPEPVDVPFDNVFEVLRSASPYDTYAELRTRDVWRLNDGTILVAGYAQVVEALTDPRLSTAAHDGRDPDAALDTSLRHETNRLLLFMDPPDHAPLRRLIGSHLHPDPVIVERTSADAGAAMVADPRDCVTQWVYPVISRAVRDLLGLDEEHSEHLIDWARACSDLLDPVCVLDGPSPPRAAGVQLMNYVRRSLPVAPHDGVAWALSDARSRGELDDLDVLTNLVSLISAALDTTHGLLSNAVALLAGSPTVATDLRRRRSLVPRFLDEVVRLESSVQMTVRAAPTALAMSCYSLAAGQRVMVLLGAANRDERVFAAGGHLDLGRPASPPHVGFGTGAHRCLGAAVARTYGEAALNPLLDIWPGLAVDLGGAQRRPHGIFRSFDALPLVPLTT